MKTLTLNPFGITDKKHWTNRGAPPKLSMFQQVQKIEDKDRRLEMRDIAISTLYADLAKAKSSGHRRFITNELIAFGEGDYKEADHGHAPKNA